MKFYCFSIWQNHLARKTFTDYDGIEIFCNLGFPVTQSFPFQMKQEAKSLLQVEIIWARSTHLSAKWANLTARLCLVWALHRWRKSPFADWKGKAFQNKLRMLQVCWGIHIPIKDGSMHLNCLCSLKHSLGMTICAMARRSPGGVLWPLDSLTPCRSQNLRSQKGSW